MTKPPEDADTRLRKGILKRCKQIMHPNFDAYIVLGTFRDEHDSTYTAVEHGGNTHALHNMVRQLALQMDEA